MIFLAGQILIMLEENRQNIWQEKWGKFTQCCLTRLFVTESIVAPT